MNLLLINGSPRKDWNTAKLLHSALEGAISKGATAELIHLYDLNFKGCQSCFACKLQNGTNYGHCAVQDELAPILEKVANADAVLLGSPIYFGNVTGEMRSFLERMAFPYIVYDANFSSIFHKKIPLGFIYTMNVDEARMQELGFSQNLKGMEMALARIFGSIETQFVTNTRQFNDYSKYVAPAFDEAAKIKRHHEIFPQDCENSFNLGIRLVTK